MILYRYKSITDNFAKTVISIGNFDGIHLGHKKIIEQLVSDAKTNNLLSGIICFEPQPQEFFNEQSYRIMQLRDKLIELKKLGLDFVLCLKFNNKLANCSADDFIKDILITKLNIKKIYVGDDFRFGKYRQGDVNLLIKYGQKYDFIVEQHDTYTHNNQRVSSSLIREYLKLGKFDKVKELLGRDYAISGRVHHGDKRGRLLGFPTINLPLKQQMAVSGVFIVKVKFEHLPQVYFGIANVGIRPTICGVKRLLETYIFNFDNNVYGKYVNISFLHRIRDEKKFNDINELKAQIDHDKQFALKWLANNNF